MKKVLHPKDFKFKYTDAWEKYKIMPGDMWKIGRHYFMCGDLMSTNLDKLMEGGQVDVYFTDPPWNQGNATTFRRKAGFVEDTVDFSAFMNKKADIIDKYARDVVYVEFGLQHMDDFRFMLESRGFNTTNFWDVVYYNKNPCVLWRGSRLSSKPIDLDVTGMDDTEFPYAVFEYESKNNKNKTSADMCLGWMGLTARASEKYNFTCYAMELNPRRLSLVVDWFDKKGLPVSKLN